MSIAALTFFTGIGWGLPSRDADPFPYACLLDEKRGQLYVSLWAQSAIAVVDLKTEKTIARWDTQEHPTEMVMTRDGKRLFVANANRNTVTVLDPETGRAMETLYAGMRPDLPPGATPCSLALSPDDSLLFIANANVMKTKLTAKSTADANTPRSR